MRGGDSPPRPRTSGPSCTRPAWVRPTADAGRQYRLRHLDQRPGGRVVGYSDTRNCRDRSSGFNGSPQAFVYSAGTMTNLGGSLGGTAGPTTSTTRARWSGRSQLGRAPVCPTRLPVRHRGLDGDRPGHLWRQQRTAGAINNLGSISGMAEDFNSQNQSSTYRLFTFAGGAIANLRHQPEPGHRQPWVPDA